MTLQGIITALVTPFTVEGEVKIDSIKPLIDFQVKGGVNGVFLCGTAGSGPIMRPDQRVQMFKESVKAIDGRISSLAHVGAASTEEAVFLAVEAEKAGVDAVGAVPPFFVKPDRTSIINHFKSIACAIKTPLYIYNIPGNALNAVTPDMMMELSSVLNITGVKDSSKDFINLLNYMRLLPEDFNVISGSDSYIYPAIMMGAKGSITGYANGFPDIYAEFMEVIKEGDVKAARDFQWRINELRGNLQKPPLASHYEALRLRGIDAGVPRAPLRSMTDSEKEELRKRLDSLGVL